MKSFLCPLPWLSVSIGNDGHQRICCHSERPHTILGPTGSPAKVTSKIDMNQALNNPGLRRIRSMLMKGEIPSECESCVICEEAQIQSPRLEALSKYPSLFQSLLKETHQDGLLNTQEIDFLDLSLGNQCNSTCLSCHPYYSNQIANKHNATKEDNTLTEINRYIENSDKITFPNTSIKTLYFQGGEPLIMKSHHEILKKLLRTNPEIQLCYSTNLTTIPKHILDLWKEFKSIQINISLDGVGELHEYIRPPAKWDKLLKNIDLLNNNPSIEKSFTTVLSALNLYDIANILNFSQQQNSPHQIIHLNTPQVLKAENLSQRSIEYAKKRWIQESRNLHKDDTTLALDQYFQKVTGGNDISPYLLVYLSNLEKRYKIRRADPLQEFLTY